MGKKYKQDGNDRVDAHSQVKYNLLRDYLTSYIRVYFQSSKVRKFKIFIADLFSGCGIMRDDISGNQIFGSPLIAVDVCRQLEEEITAEKGYPIEIEPYFFFNDLDKTACDNLKIFLNETFPNQKNCYFYNGKFETILPQVLQKIKELEDPRNGNKKFFFLDPYGYKDISMASIQAIRSAGKSEILWNFMVDYFSQYLSPDKGATPELQRLFNVTGIQQQRLMEALMLLKEDKNWHFIRHKLCQIIHSNSGFITMSDFAIQQGTSNKFMTIIHLADTPKARDVMTGTHWKHSTITHTFLHDGLQYEDILYRPNTELGFFSFSDLDHAHMLDRAEGVVYDTISSNPGISVDEVERRLAVQYSAMRRQDLSEILNRQKGEVLWYDADGGHTGNKNKVHRLQASPQLTFQLK